MEKETLRRDIRRRVDGLTAHERATASRTLCRALEQLSEYRGAGCVMMYRGLPDEVDLAELERRALLEGKHVVMPRCRGPHIDLVQVVDDPAAWSAGPFGIKEPTGTQLVEPGLVDLVLTPGRAFDRTGRRLGRGGGYYDRLFSRPGFRAVCCGVGFDCQLVDTVPATGHDRPVQLVATPSKIIRCG
ncbi:MAG: 5-formyltetrahydrofolate cyclo-ligase [Planctomycetota bacterium]